MLEIDEGIKPRAQRLVLYAPESFGKTKFARYLPAPLYIDLEHGSWFLNVKRLKAEWTWRELKNTIEDVAKEKPCDTLVIDTIDAAEPLLFGSLCARNGWSTIEQPGYGKGYVMAAEEFSTLLSALDRVIAAGINVCLLAHAEIKKMELPDSSAYDRWGLRLNKRIEKEVKEWCDALLFGNWETIVETVGDGNAAHGKARGKRKMAYATHDATHDAKNRWNLPDSFEFNPKTIADAMAGASAGVEPDDGAEDEKDTSEADCENAGGWDVTNNGDVKGWNAQDVPFN